MVRPSRGLGVVAAEIQFLSTLKLELKMMVIVGGSQSKEVGQLRFAEAAASVRCPCPVLLVKFMRALEHRLLPASWRKEKGRIS